MSISARRKTNRIQNSRPDTLVCGYNDQRPADTVVCEYNKDPKKSVRGRQRPVTDHAISLSLGALSHESDVANGYLNRMCDTIELLYADDSDEESLKKEELEAALWMDVNNYICEDVFTDYRSTTEKTYSEAVRQAARALYVIEILPQELQGSGGEIVGYDSEYQVVYAQLSDEQKEYLRNPLIIALAARRFEEVYELASQSLDNLGVIVGKNYI